MKVQGNFISFPKSGEVNDTLPPLLDNFKANKGKHETIKLQDIPLGSTFIIGKYKGKPIKWVYFNKTAYQHSSAGSFKIFDKYLISPKEFDGKNGVGTFVNVPVGDNIEYGATLCCLGQWLNSDKKGGTWYEQPSGDPNTEGILIQYSPSDYVSENGFLYEWTEQEKSSLGEITWVGDRTSKVTLPEQEALTTEYFDGARLVLQSLAEDFDPYADYNIFWCMQSGYSESETYIYGYKDTEKHGQKDDSQKGLPSPERENVTAKLHVEPVIIIDRETPFVFNGTDYVLEPAAETQPIIISADKMQESRATDLAGAVWVYGDHIPNNVNDGTKINLTREEVVGNQLGLSLTLGELPISDAFTRVIVNLPESDGKLHPYVYLTNDYNSSGKGLLIREVLFNTIQASGNKYEDGVFDTACTDFKNRLSTSIQEYLTPVTVYSWNSGTGGKNITREIFLLSQREAGGGSDVNIKMFPFFSAQNNRIAKDEGGTARGWWCREFNNTNPSYVNYQGVISSTSGSQYFRPAIAVSLDLPLNPTSKEDGSYDFLESAVSKTSTKEGKTVVSMLPSKSTVKLGRYGGNELSWFTTKDSKGGMYLILHPDSMNVSPFNEMLFDEKEPNNPDNNRKQYGNNSYIYSNIHQWLNSDKSANNWYTPQHVYDVPPPYANQSGFLNEWTEQEKAILFDKVWEVRQPDFISTTMQKFTAKVVIPSSTEAGFGIGAGGTALDILNSASNRVVNNKRWTLRSPNVSNSYQVFGVTNTGNSSFFGAWDKTSQIRPLVSIPVNTPVELGSDGAYHLLIDEMLPTVSKTVNYPKNKDFYARQFTFNPKKQYQTMLEGAIYEIKGGTNV